MTAEHLRVAVVGAGPAGLYAVGHLLDANGVSIEVDVFDRLPTPYGLVRAGVAPDHEQKKRIIDNLFAYHFSHPRVRFFGNVEFGSDVQNADLMAWYDAVIYAVGTNDDLKLNIPGEELSGIHAAREFVAWYNGHPDYAHLEFDLSGKRAVIIGNGNVALDAARMLTLPIDALRKTDITSHALAALEHSSIEEVVILGRRGAYQAAFSTPELEGLAELPGVEIRAEHFIDEQGYRDVDWATSRKISTLKNLVKHDKSGAQKRIIFRFLTSPISFQGDDQVVGLELVHNALSGNDWRTARSNATDRRSELECGFVLRSVGYRGRRLPGLPFDQRMGVIPCESGRVFREGAPLAGAYATGWIKRGARGIIGTNKLCAQETVQSLLSDAKSGQLEPRIFGGKEVECELRRRKPNLVTYQDWLRIDRSEILAGRVKHRPRVKYVNWEELNAVSKRDTAIEEGLK